MLPKKAGTSKARISVPEILEISNDSISVDNLENFENLLDNKSVKAVAILDKADSLNAAGGALFEDITSAMYVNEKQVPMVNYVYGIGGRDTTEKHNKLMDNHGWTKYFDVDILDSEGPDLVLDIPQGKIIKKT